MKKYTIQNAVGFPFSRDTTNVGKMNVVVPATLVSNVAQLHPFLYGDDAAGYTPSAKVQEISAHIQKKTGIGELPNADIPKIGGGTGVTKAAEAAANSGDSGKSGNSGQNPDAAVETPAPETAAAAESKSALESTEVTANDQTTEEESTIEELSKGEESKKDEHSNEPEASDKNTSFGNGGSNGNSDTNVSSDKHTSSGKADSSDQDDSSDRHNGGTSVKETENAGPEVGPVAPPQTTEAGPIAETAA